MKIPDGYQAVMPYLLIKDAQEFIKFTEKIFSAKVILKVMRDENSVQHAEINIGGSVIMLADGTGNFKPRETSLMIYVNNADDTFKKAVDEGASVVRVLSDQEYGRSGGVMTGSALHGG